MSKELPETTEQLNIVHVLEFDAEVEAQAIQTHNAEAAIKSAWGVDAVITVIDEKPKLSIN